MGDNALIQTGKPPGPFSGGTYPVKHKISIIVAALMIFVLALGITLYPLISNYVSQKYASTIYTKYEEMIQNVDETELQTLTTKHSRRFPPMTRKGFLRPATTTIPY